MEQQQVKLEDILAYTPDTYFSDDDLTFLRGRFNGPEGSRLLRLIRKIMLPTVSDPELPIEEIGKDIFMSAIDFKSMPEDQVKPVVMGLQLTVKAVMGGLIQLRNLANVKEETAESRAQRRARNSAR